MSEHQAHTAALDPLAHQFDDLEQQHEASNFGMWIFLATEIMFFGGLFAAYTVYRAMHPAAFEAASHHLDIALGTLNTGVLLTSSLTMALAGILHDQVQSQHLAARKREVCAFERCTSIESASIGSPASRMSSLTRSDSRRPVRS